MDRDKAFLQRLRKLIKIKLTELEVYVDDELVDYITVLLVNKKTASQMIEDLNLFLNEHSESFVIWLFNTCENFNTHEMSHENDTKFKKSKTKISSRDVKKRKDSSCSNDDKTSTKPTAEIKARENVYEREPKLSKRQHISPLPEKTRKRHVRTSNNSHKEDQTNKAKHEEIRKHADGNKGTNTVKNTTVYPQSEAQDKNGSKNVVASENNYTMRDFIDVQANEGFDNVLYENHVEHIQEEQEYKMNKFTSELANSNIELSANLIVSTQDLISNSNSNLTPTIVQSSVMKILHEKKNIASQSLFLKALHNADLRLKINQNNKEVVKERQKLPLTLDEVQQQRLVRFGNDINDSKRPVSASLAPEMSYESELTPAGKRFKEDYPVEPFHAPLFNTVHSDMEEASINSIVTSPKFIVTLDPVARTRGESRKVVFVETPTHDSTPHLAAPKRYRTTPFAANATPYQPDQGSFVGEASISMADFPDDDDVMEGIEQEGRIMERCKFWPGCKNGDNCLYHHPTIQCKNFPQCSFGDKCLFIHPNCKFDAACTKKDCPFTHASVRKDLNKVSKPQVINLPLSSNRNSHFSGVSTLGTFKVPCKFGSSCLNIGCPYLHFPECKYGIQCTRLDCMFTHPNESTSFKSKTKWVSPCYRPSNPVPPRNESANEELNRSHTMVPME